MDDQLGAHPDLDPAAAAMRAEWREEQDAATAAAAEAKHRRMTVRDRFEEHMHRGDRLAVIAAGQRLVGVPEEIGDDFVALRTLSGRVDVHLTPSVPIYFEVYERAASGGDRGVDAAGSFVNALVRHEGDREVTLGTVFDADGIDGRVNVGADHVVLIGRAGAETVIPLAQVSWVSARRE